MASFLLSKKKSKNVFWLWGPREPGRCDFLEIFYLFRSLAITIVFIKKVRFLPNTDILSYGNDNSFKNKKRITFTVKTHLKWHCPYNPWPGYSGMQQCSGTHLLTRLATLSKSGPTRTCSYTRDNPSSLIVACHYFTFDPLRRACPNDAAYMDPLIVACYIWKSQSQVNSKSWLWLFLFKKQKSSQVIDFF